MGKHWAWEQTLSTGSEFVRVRHPDSTRQQAIDELNAEFGIGGWRGLFEPFGPPMFVNVYSNGKHTRLRVEVADLSELIARCGWTVTEGIENLTPEGRREIARLEALPYIEMPDRDTESALAWWNSRVVSRAPAVTPDM
jgi:hypothetical protein